MSTLNLTNSYVNISTTLLSAVSTKVNSAGYLNQVVDPNDFSSQGAQSPEGQSFVVLAYAAYNEWDAMGRPGESGSSKSPLGKNSEAGRAVVCGIGGVVAVLAGVGVVVGWTIV